MQHDVTGAMAPAQGARPTPLLPASDASRAPEPDAASALGATRRNHLLAALARSDQLEIERHLEPVALRAGQTLVHPGVPAEDVYFPESAVIAISVDGSAEVALVGRDGLLGVSALLGIDAAGWAVVRLGGGAWRLPAARVRDALGGLPSLRPLLERHLHDALVRVARGASCERTHRARPRLAGLLCWLRDQTGSGELALTHAQLARMLGLRRRASVTEGLQQLWERQLVRVSRGRIAILDLDGLRDAACPCRRAAPAALASLSPGTRAAPVASPHAPDAGPTP